MNLELNKEIAARATTETWQPPSAQPLSMGL